MATSIKSNRWETYIELTKHVVLSGGWLPWDKVMMLMQWGANNEMNKDHLLLLAEAEAVRYRLGNGVPRKILLSNGVGDMISALAAIDMTQVQDIFIALWDDVGRRTLGTDWLSSMYPAAQLHQVPASHGPSLVLSGGPLPTGVFDLTPFQLFGATALLKDRPAFIEAGGERMPRVFNVHMQAPSWFIHQGRGPLIPKSWQNYIVVVPTTNGSDAAQLVGCPVNGCKPAQRSFDKEDWVHLIQFIERQNLEVLVIVGPDIKGYECPARFKIAHAPRAMDTMCALQCSRGYVGIDSWLSTAAARLIGYNDFKYCIVRTRQRNTLASINYFYGPNAVTDHSLPSEPFGKCVCVHTLEGLAGITLDE